MSATLAERGLLSLDAAAGAMDVSAQTVYRMTRDGRLAGIRHGGKTWVEEAEIADYFVRICAEARKRRAQRGRGSGARRR